MRAVYITDTETAGNPVSSAITGVRTVTANWQVGRTFTLLHLHSPSVRTPRQQMPAAIFLLAALSKMKKKVRVETSDNSRNYDVAIERGSLLRISDHLPKAVLRSASRAFIISNKKVFGLYGEKVQDSLRRSGSTVTTHLIGDGERFKSLRTLEKTLSAMSGARISRTDIVVALGGGVVGDLAGFAAAVYLRGIEFVQVPTTLLAMIDSSVGGKTGVNTAFGKNLVGAFHMPCSVVIDPSVLGTLPVRELTAGLCEAIKQGAVGGRTILSAVDKMLPANGKRLRPGELAIDPELVEMIAGQVAFKASIVAGDQFESPANATPRSRKILNFGHTFGHALEKVTSYRRFKHGEAVGWGILFAAELSKKLELLDNDSVKSLNDVVHRSGTLPRLDGIDPQAVIEAFRFDKKQINDSLQWILLKGIGKPVVVPGKQIPSKTVANAVKDLFRK